ncbi:TPA: hypothetical protein QCK11_004722 [Enterobacter asburiae]|nr:hypothetical protein [Enterobacter asburiae]
MRAFNDSQQDSFINAFGDNIQTSNGTSFKAILEVVPFSLGAGGVVIESTETYATTTKSLAIKNAVSVNSELLIDGVTVVVYNIQDDMSGMVDIYYRDKSSQSFAEDY